MTLVVSKGFKKWIIVEFNFWWIYLIMFARRYHALMYFLIKTTLNEQFIYCELKYLHRNLKKKSLEFLPELAFQRPSCIFSSINVWSDTFLHWFKEWVIDYRSWENSKQQLGHEIVVNLKIIFLFTACHLRF